MSKFCYLDFEFTGIQNPKLDLICCVAICKNKGKEISRHRFWLWGGEDNIKAKQFFWNAINEGFKFVSYVVEAEYRSLLSLFEKDIGNIPFIDLYLEWTQLTNCLNAYAYGDQLISGKEVTTLPAKTKWEIARIDNYDSETHHRPEKSLSSAIYKMLSIKIDTDRKTNIRNICISGSDADIKNNRKEIIEYCESDVEHLPALLIAFKEAFEGEGFSKVDWFKYAFTRGSYAVAAARITAKGYPVNLFGITNFIKNIPKIKEMAVKECIKDSEFPPFSIGKNGDIKRNNNLIKKWVDRQGITNWPKTEKGNISLKREDFYKYFNRESEGFGGAFCRFLSIEESIKGFSDNPKRKSFSDFVGSDGRVRHFQGIYGSQTGRSQAGATGFLPLKSKWMKFAIEAPKGKAIVEMDYSQQEFLFQAIMSQDIKMINTYASGDPYLAFAKSAGMVPQDATKESHKKQRNVAKSFLLGVSYDMGPASLAKKISLDINAPFSYSQAEDLIDKFYCTYSKLDEWKQKVQDKYTKTKKLTLKDGWTLFGDNGNRRSVGNFPIQGMGAVILREAVKALQGARFEIIYTLHDAIACEIDSYDFDSIKKMHKIMTDTVSSILHPYGHTTPIRVEAEVWSKDYLLKPVPEKAKKIIPEVTYMSEYVTPITKDRCDKYRHFFEGVT